ncbi:WhiB family transcriptional regulator [Nonomuraea sp. NPDC046802]|uniref:WhiB family transcriptional regulator n=1 Tax=Nonomuraea sp. NPDC046802 TaxID=3154919 RepID=UPI0033E4513F
MPGRSRRCPMASPDWEWQRRAACRGQSLVLFFGYEGERQPQKDIRERKAKEICAQCPVRVECLDYALSRPEKHGVWSLTEDERSSERRRRMRRAAMAGVTAADQGPDGVAEIPQMLGLEAS